MTYILFAQFKINANKVGMYIIFYSGGVIANVHGRIGGRIVQVNGTDAARVLVRKVSLLIARHLNQQNMDVGFDKPEQQCSLGL